ncbi:unnamed protein product [Leptidea sinapis]|uniref:G-protein coupled receptors family 2 profile 2 domain-containing protein n=1 Tax=Leptidea sinapis TaxID=189913 RepID=A0A5E4Q0R3_9NEOP|nr:unnamed protein product [Leptidea sinapis]
MLLLILLYLSTVRIYCFASEKDIVINDHDNTTCSYKKCINKCCPKNQYAIVGENNFTCTDIDFKTNYSTVYLYDRHEHDQLTNKTLSDLFMLLPGKFLNDTFYESQTFYDSFGLPTYLNEEGLVYTEVPNTYNRWQIIPNTDFCIDYFDDREFAQSVKLRLSIVELIDDDEDTEGDYLTYALIVSAVFLGLILLVYFLLPELQSLGGKILMSCVCSMMVAFVLLAIVKSGPYSAEICINLTCATYYFFMAAFCWMNVMSYDIWWTFRGYAKARQIHRRGEMFKFLMYSLYAWGVPLLMALILYFMNVADLSHVPWIIQPSVPLLGCFLTGGQQLVYMYDPMLTMLCGNYLFYFLTAFNIYRLSRSNNLVFKSAAAGSPAAHRAQKQRLMLYLKLSTIMGLNWVLEYISARYPKIQNIWYVTDTYNMLIGISLFLIFICKKKIYVKLLRRFQGMTRENYALPRQIPKRSHTSSLESDISQEIPLNGISSHPNGSNFNSTKTFKI